MIEQLQQEMRDKEEEETKSIVDRQKSNDRERLDQRANIRLIFQKKEALFTNQQQTLLDTNLQEFKE